MFTPLLLSISRESFPFSLPGCEHKCRRANDVPRHGVTADMHLPRSTASRDKGVTTDYRSPHRVWEMTEHGPAVAEHENKMSTFTGVEAGL